MHPLEGLRNMALPSAALMVLGALVWERDGLRSPGLAVAATDMTQLLWARHRLEAELMRHVMASNCDTIQSFTMPLTT